MQITEQRRSELISELRKTMQEIHRLSAYTQDLMDELEGKRDAEIERRVAEALAALRAKSRVRRPSTAKPK